MSKSALDKSFERLSSGQRINRAGDDASGLAISESLQSQIRGLKQAKRNSQDGISLIQIAEGALAQVANILIRLRELAIQASSDTVGVKGRTFLNIEFSQLLEEINRITESTEFNGVELLKGNGVSLDIQVGTGNNMFVDRVIFNTIGRGVNTASLGLALASVMEKRLAQNSISAIDQAIDSVSGVRADFGALQNRLQSVVANHDTMIENMSSANSQLRDTDIAAETARLTRGNILVRAGISVLAQTNRTATDALDLLRTMTV